MRKIIKSEGISGLFKGLIVRFLKKPLNYTITWLIFEKIL